MFQSLTDKQLKDKAKAYRLLAAVSPAHGRALLHVLQEQERRHSNKLKNYLYLLMENNNAKIQN